MSAPRFAELARGIALIAMFRREGFRLLTGSANEIVGSLIPLLFLLIASGLVQTLDRPDASKATALLAALSTVLLPVVLSEALARLWGREAAWGRYIVAFNWCQWALTFFGAASLVAADLLGALGIPRALAVLAALGAFVAYQVALLWFMARSGLELSRLRATLLVTLVEIATTGALVLFILLDTARGGDGR